MDELKMKEGEKTEKEGTRMTDVEQQRESPVAPVQQEVE